MDDIEKINNSIKKLEAVRTITGVLKSFDPEDRKKILQQSSNDVNAPFNIIEHFYLVFTEVINEVNEDKEYLNQKLAEYNKIAESMSDYLSELVSASEELEEQETSRDESNQQTIGVEMRRINLCFPVFSDEHSRFDSKLYDYNEIPYPKIKVEMNHDDVKREIDFIEHYLERVSKLQHTLKIKHSDFDNKADQLVNSFPYFLKAINNLSKNQR